MSSTAWMQLKYEETFSGITDGLHKRMALDPAFTLDDARGVLKHLYVNDGNNWVGRGELQDIIVRATIDAYEHFISIREAENPR